MTEIGTMIDGKYKILKEIGRGGMSVVYLAMDRRLNKQWAVKEIYKKGDGLRDDIVVNSLLAEADLMKRLDHPALPRIVDIISMGDSIYIVMDYIQGESLDKILLSHGPQTEELVLDWAKQICQVLLYLHSQNPPIIYRDMKPGNIIRKPEGNLKLIDFGIAREYKVDNDTDTTVLGTRGYASPEHYGARQTDIRSDIFTLGMTLHHLLTGQDPRKPGYQYKAVRQWNPKISEGMEMIIEKCTALDPEDRYQNCKDLLYDLEHPGLITKGYKKKQIRKVFIFFSLCFFTAATLLSGITCLGMAVYQNHNTYENLISVVEATSIEKKMEAYKKAVAMYPGNPKAYLRMIEAYEEEGVFGQKENNEFLAIYNRYKDQWNQKSKEVRELNYRIGMLYFNYYKRADGSSEYSDRVQKAFPFFAQTVDTEGKNVDNSDQKMADCYYSICFFYKKYILNTITIEETSKKDYDTLIEKIMDTMKQAEEFGAYDQLTFYNSVCLLLYDQRKNMESVHVEQKTLLALLEQVYDKTEKLTVQKEQSKKLQREIKEKYTTYRDSIASVYE